MDFQLTEEQKMFQSMVRDFSTNEVKPLAAKIDEEGECPHEIIKKAGSLGLFGITIAEEYGGSGGATPEARGPQPSRPTVRAYQTRMGATTLPLLGWSMARPLPALADRA